MKTKKNRLFTANFWVFLVLFVGAVFWLFTGASGQEKDAYVHGTVVEVVGEELEKGVDDQDSLTQILKVDVNGKEVEIRNDNGLVSTERVFEKGDEVVVIKNKMPDGSESYYISGFVRTKALLYLFILFVVSVLAVSRRQGLGSIIGMFLSFVVIFKVILPQILAGASPLPVAIFGSLLIIPLTFFSAHGFNKKSIISVIGTLITLVIVGLLSYYFATAAHLTGLAGEEAGYLKLETRQLIDFKGLVLAGILIGLLGVLDDITISQSAVVQEIKDAKRNIGFRELFSRSMGIGKDHIASMVNTLILVYTGAAMPLMLLFLDHSTSFVNVINIESVSQEIIQMLVGSIGLVLAVPITTVLACFVAINDKR